MSLCFWSCGILLFFTFRHPSNVSPNTINAKSRAVQNFLDNKPFGKEAHQTQTVAYNWNFTFIFIPQIFFLVRLFSRSQDPCPMVYGMRQWTEKIKRAATPWELRGSAAPKITLWLASRAWVWVLWVDSPALWRSQSRARITQDCQ